MARLKESPIGESDILEDDLLGQDDFQLEIAAYHSCKSRNIESSHGGTYEDSVTKKTRQFDIRAIIKRGICKVRLAVECKSLRDYYPLLISTLPRSADESFHEVIYAHQEEKDYLGSSILGMNKHSIRLSREFSVYAEGLNVGKSTSQVGRSVQTGEIIAGDSEVFDKWTQAVASAVDLVGDSTGDYKEYGTQMSFAVIFPVLVTNDDTLWVANYTSDGQLLGPAHKAESCELYLGKELWTGPMGVNYTFSHLHIFTKSAFDNFLDKLLSDQNYWNSLFPSDELNRKTREDNL